MYKRILSVALCFGALLPVSGSTAVLETSGTIDTVSHGLFSAIDGVAVGDAFTAIYENYDDFEGLPATRMIFEIAGTRVVADTANYPAASFHTTVENDVNGIDRVTIVADWKYSPSSGDHTYMTLSAVDYSGEALSDNYLSSANVALFDRYFISYDYIYSDADISTSSSLTGVSAVPLPASLWLLSTGLAGLVSLGRRHSLIKKV